MVPKSQERKVTVDHIRKRRFRVFLASPNDVAEERRIVRDVVEEMRSDIYIGSRIEFEPIVASDGPGQGVPVDATKPPQQCYAENLSHRPSECNLVVLILWQRMGTPIYSPWDAKPDGTPYLSGTEWEYSDAVRGSRERGGTPAIWVYRRNGEPRFSAADSRGETDRLEQWNHVESFFAAFVDESGAPRGSRRSYDAPAAFEKLFREQLRHHLQRLIEKGEIEESPDKATDAEAEGTWDHPPYPGLVPLGPEQARIFFGRDLEIRKLVTALLEPRASFLVVAGSAGAGKSSLVGAGLIPRLRDGRLAGVPWLDLSFKPAERGKDKGGPFLALAYALKEKLRTLPVPESELAEDLRRNATILADYESRLLTGADPAAELVLVIDQFEELYTQIDDSDRVLFLSLLAAAAERPRVRVVATLRNDFLFTVLQEPLKGTRTLFGEVLKPFVLRPPGEAALEEMIAGPAKLSGLNLESGLVERILKDAGSDPCGALPFVAYILQVLWESRGASGRLTLKDYEADEIGGLAGTVRQRADKALGRLDSDAERALEDLFEELVGLDADRVPTRTRAAKGDLTHAALRLAERLAESDVRLIVPGQWADRPTLELAHDVVLTAWRRLAEWIEANTDRMRLRRVLENAAAEWIDRERSAEYLRTGPELRRYLSVPANRRSKQSAEYLDACERKARRERAGKRLWLLGGAVVLMLVGAVVRVSVDDQEQIVSRAQGVAIRYGLFPVPKPKMVKIASGTFRMGDELRQWGNAGPTRSVTIPEFELGAYEVTFAEYDRFVIATKRDGGLPSDEGYGRGERPVINVSWQDAVDFAHWLARETGKAYRLPSELEWEFAARGGRVGGAFHWGDEVSEICRYGNVQDASLDGEDASLDDGLFKGSDIDRLLDVTGTSLESVLRGLGIWQPASCSDGLVHGTAPVGSFQAGPYGLYDMVGNVWEWVQDCYLADYEESPVDGSARDPSNPDACDDRVVRGGGWFSQPSSARPSFRLKGATDLRISDLGFRIARSL